MHGYYFKVKVYFSHAITILLQRGARIVWQIRVINIYDATIHFVTLVRAMKLAVSVAPVMIFKDWLRHETYYEMILW